MWEVSFAQVGFSSGEGSATTLLVWSGLTCFGRDTWRGPLPTRSGFPEPARKLRSLVRGCSATSSHGNHTLNQTNSPLSPWQGSLNHSLSAGIHQFRLPVYQETFDGLADILTDKFSNNYACHALYLGQPLYTPAAGEQLRCISYQLLIRVRTLKTQVGLQGNRVLHTHHTTTHFFSFC